MPAIRHCSRINTFELKLQMETRLGSHKAEKYFNLLTRYLSRKLGKSEFDKLCIRLIGRENTRHHNELIKAIVKNATDSKIPPTKPLKRDSSLTFKDSNGIDPRDGLQSLGRDVFPQSPKKGMTPNLRERKFKDRPSPLGFNEKAHAGQDFAVTKVNEVENGKEVELDLLNPATNRRIPISAPFGISIHPKETQKVLHSGSGDAFDTDTCHFSGQFPPTNSLENRLKWKLKMEGLDISTDCVHLLNNGLDSYLKRVIKPTLELAGSRCLHKQGKMFTMSMLDFRVATETHSKILGEHWPIQVEKISLFGFK